MGDVGSALERLVEIMARLRAQGGCPWDREQDLRSLRPYLVEETYEVLDEMDRVSHGGSWRPLCEELGDLLFQIVFHAQLATEIGEFTMAQVSTAIADKIVSRHPHVFAPSSQKVSTSTEVLENWAKLKALERKRKTGSEGSVLDGVPSAAPGLLRAERLTEKASRIGFDWPTLEGVRQKLDEELAELDEAIEGGDRDELEHELGDVLFSLANLARFIKTPAEDALRQANARFTSRFHRIEKGLLEAGVPFGQASLEQMEALWQQAKEEERGMPPPLARPRAVVTRARLEISNASDGFFARLSALLGWQVLKAPAPQKLFDAGGLQLLLIPARHEPSSGIELSLEVSSRAFVDAAYAELRRWPEISSSAPASVEGRYWMSFADPDGRTWRLGTDGGLSTGSV